MGGEGTDTLGRGRDRTVHFVHCTLHIANCTVHTTDTMLEGDTVLDFLHCLMSTVNCIQKAAYCTLQTVPGSLLPVHCKIQRWYTMYF